MTNTTFTTSKLSLDDIVEIVQSEDDPKTGLGFAAAIGSIHLRSTTGGLFIKTGVADTDWVNVVSDATVGVSANNASTGILDGGALSVNIDPTKFDLAAGVGIIVDNHTGTLNPTADIISWPTTVGITTTDLASTDRSFIAIDGSGTILQNNTDWSNSDHKHFIVIGNLGHANRTSIVAFRNNPDPSFDATARLSDLARALGPFNVDGNIFFPNGVNLQINKSAGHTYRIGNNFQTNKEDTDNTTDGTETAVNFLYSHLDGVGGHTLVTPATNTITPALYDDGSGVLAAVPGGQWQVMVIKYFSGIQGGPSTRIEYGQQLFSTVPAALDLLPDPTHIDNPAFAAGVVRGYLLVSAGASDLSDPGQALFVEAAKFGTSGGGQFSGSVTNLQKAYENSLNPEIVTNVTLGAISIEQGLGVGGNILEGYDDTSTLTFSLAPDGTLPNTTISDLGNVYDLMAPVGGSVLYYDIANTRWDSAIFFVPGTKQTIQSVFGNIPAISGTTDLLQSIAAPLVTDGTQAWTSPFIPSRADGEIGIIMSFAFAITNAASEVVIAIFRDSVCIGAMVDTASSSGGYQTVSFAIKDPGPFVAGVPITYQARVGRNGGNATWYINDNSSGENFGGVLSNNAYTISEVVIL